MGREQKGQVANGNILDQTMLFREFRLAMLCYWLTFEHSVLFETAGTARKSVCPTETQLGLMNEKLWNVSVVYTETIWVRFSFELNSKFKLLDQALTS